ncbi:MAG: response regulator [Candidatus Hydrogenedentota bacterium]|nr:MAG: response regulator [Candidatus Hydrogenedentota bacterium]
MNSEEAVPTNSSPDIGTSPAKKSVSSGGSFPAFPRFLRRSLRAKIMTLVGILAVLMFLGHLTNGIMAQLAATTESDEALLTQVRLLRVMAQNLFFNALSLRHAEEPEFYREGLRASVVGFGNTLAVMEPEPPPSLLAQLSPKEALQRQLFRRLVETERIRSAVDDVRLAWEAAKPLFESAASEGGAPVAAEELIEATNEILDRISMLEDVLRDLNHAKVMRLRFVNFCVLIGGLGTFLVLFLALQKVVLNPLMELRNVTQRFSEGERGARVRGNLSEDELGELARIFNEMADRVVEREERIQVMNRKLMEAAHMKSKFLAMMSHELRTPMNSIIGYTDVLLDGLDGELNAEQREDLEAISRAAQHLLTMINEILDLSKIEAGHMRMNPTEVRLRDIVQDVAVTIEPLVEQKNLEHTREFREDDIVVIADRDRLKQIVMNLLSNAVKFTETGRIKTILSKDETWGILEVEDTGIGIPKEHLQRIFEDFHQVDDRTNRKHAGTGLGLAIVKKLVEMMEGDISVESEVGKGSRFRVRLPLAWPRKRLEPKTGPVVLVVEDDPEMQALYDRYLAGQKIRKREARSLEAARRLLEEREGEEEEIPAAVILDIRLPDGDGTEFLREMRRNPMWKDVPCAVVSVEGEPDAAREWEVEAILTKPVSREDFLRVLGEMVKMKGERKK